MTDPVTLAWIGLATSAVTGVLLVVNTLIANQHTKDLARLGHDVKETKSTVTTLEKNTNSMKDELVKITGKAAYAEGLKVGTEAGIAAGIVLPVVGIPGGVGLPIPLPVIVVEDPINPGDPKWAHKPHDMDKKT